MLPVRSKQKWVKLQRLDSSKVKEQNQQVALHESCDPAFFETSKIGLTTLKEKKLKKSVTVHCIYKAGLGP